MKPWKNSSLQPSSATVRVALLSLLFTAINAFKPIHVDDTAYFLFAQHIAHTPLDPYGFWLFWVDVPEPAMNVLAPPVFLYYWAVLIKLFGVSPVLWKLACFPIHFLYMASLHFVVRRFAPSIVWPTLLLIAFSPVVLPGTNMMLELPVQSLFFAGLASFMLACERSSLRYLSLSAVLVALCIETKYTGMIIVPTLFLYASVNRRMYYAITVSLMGLTLFGTIEIAIQLASGASHFLVHFDKPRTVPFVQLAEGLTGQLGGGGIGLLGLALLAFQVKQRFASGILLGWLALVVASCFVDPRLGRTIFRVVAHTTGVSVLVALLWGVVRINRFDRARGSKGLVWDPQALFLSLWLLGEIAFYFLVSPFPAMRRIIGISTVSALLLARWIDSQETKPAAQRLAIAIASSLLVAGFYVMIDVQWAKSVKASVAWAKAEVGELSAEQTVWYHGVWGFKYYAMEEGMRAYVAGQSVASRGDYLLLARAGVAVPKGDLDLDRWEEVARYRAGPMANLKFSSYYYGTVPLSVGAREAVRVGLYRRL